MKLIATCAMVGALLSAGPESAIAVAGTGAMRTIQPSHPVAAATHSAPPTSLGPTRTGQPNQSCETTPNTPGKSAAAPGSAFNPSGRAGTVYAGEQPQNSRNTASVSQYDVACARPSR